MGGVWIGGVAMLALGLGLVALGHRLRGWERARDVHRRDARRRARQREWRRRLQAGEAVPARCEVRYGPGEPVDEDAARMAELGYHVVDEVGYGDGSRRLVYRRRPGASTW